MKFTHAPVAWTPDTVCDSDKFNLEIKEKMDDINEGLSSKIISASRDMTAVGGDVIYTGVGFTPTAIQCIAVIDGTYSFSIGFVDSLKTNKNIYIAVADNMAASSNFIYLQTSSTTAQGAIVKSFDVDGFTLTWTKISTPAGTGALIFLCFR